MAGDWEWAILGEVATNHDARRIPVKEADRKPGKYPYYGASGIIDYVDDYLFDGEYLLVAEDGENLRTRQTPIAFMATGRFWVNNHAHILEGSSKALTRFLHYALVSADVQPFLTGAVMPKLTQANLNRIPLMLPPKKEQESIVALLGSLDQKIELNQSMAHTLEGMMRALFKSWFVDFDPVRAEAEARPGRFPPELAAIFPKNLGKDDLPVGWVRRPIGEIFDISGGNTPSTANPAFWDGPHQWATPKDLASLTSPVLLETDRRLSDAGLNQCSSGLLPPGSLLLSSRAPIGYMAFTSAPTAINQGFAGITRKNVSTAYA
jgi:type I restriction enzyme, S subunit